MTGIGRHHAVARDLGDDRSSRDGRDVAVALDDGRALKAALAAGGRHVLAVDEDADGRHRQRGDGARHGPQRGGADVQPVDAGRRGRGHRHHVVAADDGEHFLARVMVELLGVGEALR